MKQICKDIDDCLEICKLIITVDTDLRKHYVHKLTGKIQMHTRKRGLELVIRKKRNSYIAYNRNKDYILKVPARGEEGGGDARRERRKQMKADK